MIEAACGIMYNKENFILLGKRNSKNTKYPNLWEFPGGKREKGETIHECLRREWMEELNLHIEIEREIHQSNYDGQYLCRFFVGKILDEDNLQLHDHDEVLFLKKDEICQKQLFEGDHLIIDKL
jgi:8-oxo-dGTP diphosphatase